MTEIRVMRVPAAMCLVCLRPRQCVWCVCARGNVSGVSAPAAMCLVCLRPRQLPDTTRCKLCGMRAEGTGMTSWQRAEQRLLQQVLACRMPHDIVLPHTCCCSRCSHAPCHMILYCHIHVAAAGARMPHGACHVPPLQHDRGSNMYMFLGRSRH